MKSFIITVIGGILGALTIKVVASLLGGASINLFLSALITTGLGIAVWLGSVRLMNKALLAKDSD